MPPRVFKGETVYLKSGGPAMSVQRTIEETVSGDVKCVWYVGTVRHEGEFPEGSLEHEGAHVGG